MQTRFEIFTGYSPFFIPLCLLGGAAYAYFLYSSKYPWSNAWNYILSGLRFIVVSVLLFLLLGPFVRYIKSFTEKAIIVIALDNSASMVDGKLATQKAAIENEINSFKKSVSSSLNVDVEIRGLNGTAISGETIEFDQPATNLSAQLEEIKNIYENRPLSQVILVSDGIVNQGNSPLYSAFAFPIHTVGTGDTTVKNDLVLKNIYSNKVAFIGNKFPIVAEIVNQGFKGKEIKVQLLQKGNLVDKKSILLENGAGIAKVEFTVQATNKGLQGYTIQIIPEKGEYSEKNNSATTYIDVIDTKTNILLVAPAPHPDIQAIARVIAKNENYSFTYFIPGITEYKEDRYGLVIFHQVPNQLGIGSDVMTKLMSQSAATWFIAGPETEWQIFNKENKVVKLENFNGQSDAVTPCIVSNFSAFSLESAHKDYISKYPPMDVPFGDIKLLASSKSILVQKIGSTTTEKPLLAYAENDGKKSAVLMGSGLWQWSLQEYAEYKNQETFDELVMKTVQYLSTTVDKRKLRIYPVSNEFLESEKPSFRAEVYNGLYEKVFGQKIDLEIKSESGKKSVYTFYNSENGAPFETASMPEGVYTFTAKATVNNVAEVSSGQFLVKRISLESLNQTADHDFLRKLAQQNSGQFVKQGKMNDLVTVLNQKPPKGRTYSREENEPLINLTWIFFGLLALVSVEWFFRKFLGGY